MVDVRWPGSALDAAATDLKVPLDDLLVSVDLLASKEDAAKGVTVRETPYSLQVISAGGLAMSKLVAGLIASGSLLTAATAVKAYFDNQEPSVRIALVAAIGVLLSATVIAIAIIVRSDVMARAEGTAAQYAARASLSAAFVAAAAPLQVKQQAAPPAAPVAPNIGQLLASLTGHGTLVVTNTLGETGEVVGVRQPPHGNVEIYMSQGDWVPATEVTTFLFQR